MPVARGGGRTLRRRYERIWILTNWEPEHFMGQLSHMSRSFFRLSTRTTTSTSAGGDDQVPPGSKDIIQYVEINGRTKIAIRAARSANTSRTPRSPWSLGPAPGGVPGFRQPDGKKREPSGEPMKSIPCVLRAGSAGWRWMDELGLDRTLMFPTLASLDRGAAARRSGRHPRHRPPAQPVVRRVWGFNYQNRISPRGHHPADRREGHRGTGVGRPGPGAIAILVRPALARVPWPRSFALARVLIPSGSTAFN